MKKGGMVEFADPNLHGEFSMEAFRLVFELALMCIGKKQERPSSSQVIINLEEAIRISTRMEAATPPTTPDWSKIP